MVLSDHRQGKSAREEGRVYPDPIGFVYFARLGEDGPIKIGFTMGKPRTRISELQVGCPYPINLIGFVRGSKRNELVRHSAYRKHRIRGEWFTPTKDLVFVINRILSPGFDGMVNPDRWEEIWDQWPLPG